MSRRCNNAATAAPIETLAIVKKTLDLHRFNPAEHIAKRLAGLLLRRGKNSLHFLRLTQPQRLFPGGNERCFLRRAIDQYFRICLFDRGSRSHMIMIVMGKHKPG